MGDIAFAAVNAAFGSLGRICMSLDERFRVRHVSQRIDALLGAGTAARMLGAEGMHRVADFATLNANYLMAELQKVGYAVAFPERRASHEFIVSAKELTVEPGAKCVLRDPGASGWITVQGSGRIGRQRLAPQFVDEPVHGHEPVGFQQQYRQHQALAGAGRGGQALCRDPRGGREC